MSLEKILHYIIWFLLSIIYLIFINIFLKEKISKKNLNILLSISVLTIILISFKIRLNIAPIPVEVFDGYFKITLSYFYNGTFSLGERHLYFQLLILSLVKIFNSFSSIVFFNLILGVFGSIITFYICYKIFLIKNIKSIYFKIVSIFSLFITIFLMSTSSQRVYYEYCLRPEIISHFFQILLIYIFYKLVKSNSLNKKYLFIFSFLSIFLVFFQNKYIFVSILNIIISIFLIYKSHKNFYELFKNIFIYILFPLIFFLFINNKIEKKLLISKDYLNQFNYIIHFWRNQKIINTYIVKDYSDPNFKDFDKNLLKKYIDFYKTIETYYPENKNINVHNFDKIMYEYSKDLDLGEKEVTSRFRKYYYFKSLINSPLTYIKSYFYEIDKLYIKQEIKFFKRIPYYLPKDISSAHDYLVAISKDMPSKEFDKYINETDSLKNYYLTKNADSNIVLTDNVFVKYIYSIINYFYFYLVFIFILILNLNKYIYKIKVNNLLKNMSLYTISLIFLLNSLVAFTFLFIDRYIDEVYPLYLFCFFFMFLYVTNFFITLVGNEKK